MAMFEHFRTSDRRTSSCKMAAVFLLCSAMMTLVNGDAYDNERHHTYGLFVSFLFFLSLSCVLCVFVAIVWKEEGDFWTNLAFWSMFYSCCLTFCLMVSWCALMSPVWNGRKFLDDLECKGNIVDVNGIRECQNRCEHYERCSLGYHLDVSSCNMDEQDCQRCCRGVCRDLNWQSICPDAGRFDRFDLVNAKAVCHGGQDCRQICCRTDYDTCNSVVCKDGISSSNSSSTLCVGQSCSWKDCCSCVSPYTFDASCACCKAQCQSLNWGTLCPTAGRLDRIDLINARSLCQHGQDCSTICCKADYSTCSSVTCQSGASVSNSEKVVCIGRSCAFIDCCTCVSPFVFDASCSCCRATCESLDWRSICPNAGELNQIDLINEKSLCQSGQNCSKVCCRDDYDTCSSVTCQNGASASFSRNVSCVGRSCSFKDCCTCISPYIFDDSCSCCKATCQSLDWRSVCPRAGQLNRFDLVNFETSCQSGQNCSKVCCRADYGTCSSVSCVDGKTKENASNVVCVARSCSFSDCCIPACDKFKCLQTSRRVDPRPCAGELCDYFDCCYSRDEWNFLRLPKPCVNCTGTTGAILCSNCTNKNILSCREDLCMVREPDCASQTGDADTASYCQEFLKQSTCEDSADLCSWQQPQLALQWTCTNKTPAFQLKCSQQKQEAACLLINRCQWSPVLIPVSPCVQGEWLPCRAKLSGSAVQEQCFKFKTQSDCNSQQIACTWLEDDQCACPMFVFGSICQNTISVWDQENPQCQQSQSQLSICNGIVYGALYGAESSECLASEGCQAWHLVKKVAGDIYMTQLTILILDGLHFVIIGGAACNLFLKSPKVIKWGLLWVVIIFLLDTASGIWVLISAKRVYPDVQALQSSLCFTQGDGFATVVLLADKIANMILLNGLQIALAFVGVVSEIVGAFKELTEKGQLAEDNRLALVCQALSVLMELGQLAISCVDFAVNGAQFTSGLTAIDASSLQWQSGTAGLTCAKLNKAWPAVGPRPISISKYLVIALPAAVSFFMVLTAGCMYLRKTSSVPAEEEQRTASAASIQVIGGISAEQRTASAASIQVIWGISASG